MLKNKKKITKQLSTSIKIYLILIALFMGIICFDKPNLIILAIATYVVIVILTYVFKSKSDNELFKMIQELTLNLDNTTGQAIVHFPFPIVVLKESGVISWKNEIFNKEFANENINEYIEGLAKEIKLNETEKNARDTVIGNKNYQIISETVKLKSSSEKFYIIYFVNNTDYKETLKKYENDKTCMSIIMIDNYDEVMQRISDETKSLFMAEIEKNIHEWAKLTGGVILKTERDKFVYIFRKVFLQQIEDSKFSILDSVKEINLVEKAQVTLSIAISTEGNSEYEKYKSANAALDIALGRGGDQAIIKKNGKYHFFGGRATELEKRTKVKARIVAHALEELILEAENVIIMGHANGDIDSIGSALGLSRLVKTLNKKPYIVYTYSDSIMENYMKNIYENKEYEGLIVDKEEAFEKITKDTLLVIVDTHKIGYVEIPELLNETEKIVVIDHHRRATDFIDTSMLTFHEVYASSTAELVAEIIQYASNNPVLLSFEAESLYAGIMIDTKNFTLKTGVRTFEAAAYLKRIGIDILKIKKWFQSNLEDYNVIADIVRNAEIVKDTIAISTHDNYSNKTNVVCAKGADELLTINNVTASFVIGDLTNNKVCISGRSIGDINVQVILEKLGGGGHITVAGTQLENITIIEAKEKLIESINEYFDETIN